MFLERNVYIMVMVNKLKLHQNILKKSKNSKTGKVYIDNQLNFKISDDVLDRQTMANEGVVMIVAQINENDRTLAQNQSYFFGLVSDKQDKFFFKEIEDLLTTFLENVKPGILKTIEF